MVKATRVLYGLHERFVLFPYQIGAKRSRLVVRAKHLRAVCSESLDGLEGRTIFPVGAPFVLGELLNADVERNDFIPVVLSGARVHDLRDRKVTWAQRYHRVIVTPKRQLSFQSGTQHVFATKTAYYDFQVLLDLMEEPSHEPNPRARFRGR